MQENIYALPSPKTGNLLDTDFYVKYNFMPKFLIDCIILYSPVQLEKKIDVSMTFNSL